MRKRSFKMVNRVYQGQEGIQTWQVFTAFIILVPGQEGSYLHLSWHRRQFGK